MMAISDRTSIRTEPSHLRCQSLLRARPSIWFDEQSGHGRTDAKHGRSTRSAMFLPCRSCFAQLQKQLVSTLLLEVLYPDLSDNLDRSRHLFRDLRAQPYNLRIHSAPEHCFLSVHHEEQLIRSESAGHGAAAYSPFARRGLYGPLYARPRITRIKRSASYRPYLCFAQWSIIDLLTSGSRIVHSI